MTGVRRALIVATDEYSDPKLAQLNAPASDARALADVLQDEHVGAFEVQTVLNGDCRDVEIALARFLATGKRGDTLLLHFSCHGVKDLSGELYFATRDTDLSLLKVTGVASSLVKEAIDESRASLILCLVDCCYSGAFTKSTKAAATLDLTERLGGQGRAVITASTSLQLALDGKESPSLFTRVVVEGLRSGEADQDLDGLVSLDELYSFVHERVIAENPDQTPLKSFDVQGDVYVARRSGPVTTPAPLPRNLIETLASGEVWERRGAVTRLAELLVAGHPGRAVAARAELERLATADDSSSVRQDAAEALATGGAAADVVPQIPPYADTGSETDTDTESDTGPAVRPPPTPPLPPPPPSPDRWKRVLAGAAALLVAVGAAVAVWFAVAGDDDGGGDGEDDVVALTDSELLVPTAADGQKQILVLDIDSGETRTLLSGEPAFAPTISLDRTAMAYLVGPREARVAYQAPVDGSRGEPVLSSAQRETCPYSSRPAESTDGQAFAMVCLGESGESTGLYVGGQDGELRLRYESSRIVGAPTWTDDGTIVVSMPASGESGPLGLWELPADGDDEPQLRTPDDGTWATHPDWSEAGLLYLGSETENAGGDVHVLDGSDDQELTTRGDVKSPTWSPDGNRIAYVASGSGDGVSVWVQDAEPDATADEFPMDGSVGPPAWGSR